MFCNSTVSIFGALASEIHTKSQCHTPDPRTFFKSCPLLRDAVEACGCTETLITQPFLLKKEKTI